MSCSARGQPSTTALSPAQDLPNRASAFTELEAGPNHSPGCGTWRHDTSLATGCKPCSALRASSPGRAARPRCYFLRLTPRLLLGMTSLDKAGNVDSATPCHQATIHPLMDTARAAGKGTLGSAIASTHRSAVRKHPQSAISMRVYAHTHTHTRPAIRRLARILDFGVTFGERSVTHRGPRTPVTVHCAGRWLTCLGKCPDGLSGPQQSCKGGPGCPQPGWVSGVDVPATREVT